MIHTAVLVLVPVRVRVDITHTQKHSTHMTLVHIMLCYFLSFLT